MEKYYSTKITSLNYFTIRFLKFKVNLTILHFYGLFFTYFFILDEILVRDVTLPPTIKEAIERKLKQEQESLEYEFRLVTAEKEAERQRIEAQGKADANKILSAYYKIWSESIQI